MRHAIALTMLALWGPIVLAIARALGPRRGATIGLLAGFLLLPRSPAVGWLPFGFLTLDRRTIPGLAALLAVALLDRRAPLRFRPSAVDLTAVGLVLAPLPSLAARGFAAPLGSIGQVWIHLTEWGLPYLIGRVYYGGEDGARRLGTAVAVAGFLYIPLVLFEAALGPDWYLAGRIYGVGYNHGMEERLGGWRPETFLNNGLELAEWMGLAATMACWMWACSGWSPRPLPPWLPAPALVLGSLAVRGVYGYAVLALGLMATAATRLFRVRLFLMLLTLVPPAYMAARISGAWDGRGMVRLAERAGRRGTVEVRLFLEDQGIARARESGLVFGAGTRYPDWMADGRWLAPLRGAGLVGLALHYAAILGPAAALIWRRRSPVAPTSPEMGLALFVVLHAIDSLQNTALILPVPLLCGALAGASAAGVPRPDRPRRRPQSAGAGHATYRVGELGRAPVDRAGAAGPIAPVLAIACLLYVFGHAPVDGQDGAKFVGGLGSALLFAAAGAAAGTLRHPPRRAAAFGLAFGALGVSFNLALHPSTRPVGSGDILQGIALSGVLVALWRPRVDGGLGGVGAFAALAAAGASWWAFGGAWRPFPGSQYLFSSGDLARSPFPVAPWLTMAALGAILVRSSTARALAMAAGFAAAAAMAWPAGWPFGPPSKFPMNPTYALLGAALASAAFAASGPIRAWRRSRAAADWLGRRWLAFFYIHLGVAVALGRAGLTEPAACWAAMAAISMAATWLITLATGRARGAFRRPTTWAVIGASTMAVGLLPGVPPVVVMGVAGVAGLLFASRYEDLAALVLGPPSPDREPLDAPGVDDRAGYLARLALVAVALAAPELVDRLPPPIGTGGRAASSVVAGPPAPALAPAR